jgi:hypothetical protein
MSTHDRRRLALYRWNHGFNLVELASRTKTTLPPQR